jgi:hypothetical protein
MEVGSAIFGFRHRYIFLVQHPDPALHSFITLGLGSNDIRFDASLIVLLVTCKALLDISARLVCNQFDILRE